jgi:hypothetical protein
VNLFRTLALIRSRDRLDDAGRTRLTDLVNRDDVRMIQRRGRLGLLREALQTLAVIRQTGGENFERDAASEALIAGAVDIAHATGREQRQDAVGSNARPLGQRLPRGFLVGYQTTSQKPGIDRFHEQPPLRRPALIYTRAFPKVRARAVTVQRRNGKECMPQSERWQWTCYSPDRGHTAVVSSSAARFTHGRRCFQVVPRTSIARPSVLPAAVRYR